MKTHVFLESRGQELHCKKRELDTMPVGKCEIGEQLTDCTGGGNAWADFEWSDRVGTRCKTGHPIGVQVNVPTYTHYCVALKTTTTTIWWLKYRPVISQWLFICFNNFFSLNCDFCLFCSFTLGVQNGFNCNFIWWCEYECGCCVIVNRECM